MQKLHVLLVVLAKRQLSLMIHVNIDRLNYARTFLVIFLVIVNWGLGNKIFDILNAYSSMKQFFFGKFGYNTKVACAVYADIQLCFAIDRSQL